MVLIDFVLCMVADENIFGPTNGTEGMAELQVESVDRHLITYRQDSHSGEVAGGVGDISTGCHTGQTQG